MKKFILFSILLMAAGTGFAQSDTRTIFQQANGLYEKGNYPQAIELYESLRTSGRANAAVYYNLGNAYFRTQAPGKAILNYERALRLNPRDREIRYNLAFVRKQVKEPPQPFVESVVTWFNTLVSLNELTVISSLFFIIFIAGLILYLVRRQQLVLALNLLSLGAVIIFGGWFFLKFNQEVSTRWAITISGPVEARNGPGADNSVGFTLPEGRKVTVLGEKDSWTAIGLPAEGLKGWIENKYIEKIG